MKKGYKGYREVDVVREIPGLFNKEKFEGIAKKDKYEQPMFCCVCGKPHFTDFNRFGNTCSAECKEEYEWRKTLCICREEYRPKNRERI